MQLRIECELPPSEAAVRGHNIQNMRQYSYETHDCVSTMGPEEKLHEKNKEELKEYRKFMKERKAVLRVTQENCEDVWRRYQEKCSKLALDEDD
jgi:hypothetical protein